MLFCFCSSPCVLSPLCAAEWGGAAAGLLAGVLLYLLNKRENIRRL